MCAHAIFYSREPVPEGVLFCEESSGPRTGLADSLQQSSMITCHIPVPPLSSNIQVLDVSKDEAANKSSITHPSSSLHTSPPLLPPPSHVSPSPQHSRGSGPSRPLTRSVRSHAAGPAASGCARRSSCCGPCGRCPAPAGTSPPCSCASGAARRGTTSSRSTPPRGAGCWDQSAA